MSNGQQQASMRNIDLLMAQIRDYIDTRALAAIRINPRLEGMYEDIAWQQMTQVRLVLAGYKAFGPVKVMVADILLSDDEKKIRDLFNPTNQVSILTEIVQMKEDKGQKTAGQLEVHDMPSFYKALDPSLEKIVLLIQSWIWWDLEDATDLVKIEQILGRILQIDQAGVPQALAAYYAEQFRVPAQHMTQDVVVGHELGCAMDTLKKIQSRRETEEGYRVIIKREAPKDASPEALIRAMGRHYMMLDALREGRGLDENMRLQFSKALGIAPHEVTPERVVPVVERALEEGRTRLRAALTGQGGGKPFDYKRWQFDQLNHKFEQVRKGRQPQKLSIPKPDAQR